MQLSIDLDWKEQSAVIFLEDLESPKQFENPDGFVAHGISLNTQLACRTRDACLARSWSHPTRVYFRGNCKALQQITLLSAKDEGHVSCAWTDLLIGRSQQDIECENS